MDEFLDEAKKGKKSFSSFLLSFCLCALALILASNTAGIYYIVSTGNNSFTLQELGLFYGKNTFFFLQLFPFIFALITLLLCIKLIHKRPVLSIFTSRESFDFKRFFVSFFIWSSLLAVILLFDMNRTGKIIQWNFQADTFWILVLISMVFVSIQTLFEEVLFRGFLLQGFAVLFKQKWISVVITSLLFAALHLNNPEIDILGPVILIYFFGTGIFLALISYFDQGLELGSGFHAANNLFGAIILTNNWQVFQTEALYKDYSDPNAPYEVLKYLLVIYPLLLLIYAKIYNWKFSTLFAKLFKK